LVVLEFKLRALSLLGSTISAMPPALPTAFDSCLSPSRTRILSLYSCLCHTFKC
jgi:hypothetical protein